MADWIEFNKGVREIGAALAKRAQAQQAQKDAISNFILQEQVKNQMKAAYDPESQLMSYALDRMRQPQIASSPESSSPEMVPVSQGVSPDKLIRGVMSKKFGVPYEEMMTPEENKAKIARKTDEQMALQEVKSRVTPQKQQEDLKKAQSAYQNLRYMKEKATNLPSGYGAFGANFSNFRTRGESNPQLALYEKQMPAMAVAIYRDITGDTRLSDDDAKKRAYPLLWDPSKGEGESIKKGTFEDLERLYQARLSLIQKGQYKVNPLDANELITPLEEVLAEAKIGASNSSAVNRTASGIEFSYKKVGE